MGTGKRRKAAQIARDRLRMSDLYLQGQLQADIASELGLSEATVSRDLKVLHKEWLAGSQVGFSKARARELAKIDRLEREYWEAWKRSRTGGQAGDPRFLTGIQWCIERRCKIMGIDAPTKMDLRINELDAAIEQGLAKLAATGQMATPGAAAPEDDQH